MAKSGEIDVLIFDEFQAAYAHGLLDKEAAKDFILKKPATLELVLTGRNPDPVFLEAADYVSEIHGVRHPYQKQIPVIAAGGIADGRGMAAAFMLGAKGIQMGTVFAASKESVIHENYKNSILKAKDIDSRVTGRSTGHPIRVLRNDMARKYLELEKSGAPFEELEQLTLGSLRKAVQEGDTKNGSLMAGQIAGMIKEERTCADIISSTVSEACKLMNGVSANE